MIILQFQQSFILIFYTNDLIVFIICKCITISHIITNMIDLLQCIIGSIISFPSQILL